ncbi:MAG: hypothetical protein RMH75_07540, partial [Archaeoglobaceae archaeon]|nr:hypothetical protein [Archaeoglobaceae archaeon]
MNKYVVKLDEKFCQERWGVVREAYVYIKLSEEVVKTIYKSSNGNVYFKTMQDSIVLSASASIFYNAERAVERAIEQAVKEKLRTFEKYVDRFEITLDEIDLKEFFAELEKVKTYERMCNIAK